MNFEHIRLFTRLAVTRNISLAGKELGISPAVASAHIHKLEQGLGVRLVHRTTRRVSLTEEGEAFLPYAADILSSVEAARSSVGSGSTSPSGNLRVTAPASFGRMHLMPGLSGFLSVYPDLNVDFMFSDSIVDLVEGGFDIAIRNAGLKDSTLIARKLAPDRRIVCASPNYVAKYGEPKTPTQLKQHHCVNLTGLETWLFDTPEGKRAIKTKGRFRTDNGEAVRDACAEGVGITMISTWSAYVHLQKGELLQVLKSFPLISNTGIWAVYPSSRLLAPKVRAFIDYYAELFGSEPYWDRGI